MRYTGIAVYRHRGIRVAIPRSSIQVRSTDRNRVAQPADLFDLLRATRRCQPGSGSLWGVPGGDEERTAEG